MKKMKCFSSLLFLLICLPFGNGGILGFWSWFQGE